MTDAEKKSPEGIVHIPVSYGELFDKIAILEIKSERIAETAKLQNVRHELALLSRVRDESVVMSPGLAALAAELKSANTALWDLEEDIRVLQREGDLGERFAKTADAIHRSNDHRMAIKRRLNELLGSGVMEEKSYDQRA